jgi:hypothetical protein
MQTKTELAHEEPEGEERKGKWKVESGRGEREREREREREAYFCIVTVIDSLGMINALARNTTR